MNSPKQQNCAIQENCSYKLPILANWGFSMESSRRWDRVFWHP